MGTFSSGSSSLSGAPTGLLLSCDALSSCIGAIEGSCVRLLAVKNEV
jgi:hypothetical protein